MAWSNVIIEQDSRTPTFIDAVVLIMSTATTPMLSLTTIYGTSVDGSMKENPLLAGMSLSAPVDAGEY